MKRSNNRRSAPGNGIEPHREPGDGMRAAAEWVIPLLVIVAVMFWLSGDSNR